MKFHLVKTMFIGCFIFMLSGCMTMQLTEKIKGDKTYTYEKSTDTLTDLYLKQDGGTVDVVQIKGDEQSYMMLNGYTDFVKVIGALGDESRNVQIKSYGDISLFKEQSATIFDGKVNVVYSLKLSENKEKTAAMLIGDGFDCDGDICSIQYLNINGSVSDNIVMSEKNKVVHLQNPSSIRFSKEVEKTSGASYALGVLYPFAIVGDILTSPFQLIFLAITPSHYGK